MKIPIKRNVSFDFSNYNLTDWSKQGELATQTANTLSVIFPSLEKYLVKSFRSIDKNSLGDDLSKAIDAFIQQEASHARYHLEFNKKLTEIGLPAKELENFTDKILSKAHKLSLKDQIMFWAVVEHLTAVFSYLILNNENGFLEKVDGDLKEFWEWHAIEEEEHKSVAFDAMMALHKDTNTTYVKRIIYFTGFTFVFWFMFLFCYGRLLSNCKNIFRNTGSSFSLRNAMLPARFVIYWTKFYKRDFHPSLYSL